VLSVFALLLAISLLFQFTAQRADIQNAQETLDGIENLAQQGTEQRDLILDCTNPQGKCFKKAQSKTAEIVTNLNIVTQYSVICGERVDGEMEILDCVNREVKEFLDRAAKEEQNN
jgi:hypothetical protein